MRQYEVGGSSAPQDRDVLSQRKSGHINMALGAYSPSVIVIVTCKCIFSMPVRAAPLRDDMGTRYVVKAGRVWLAH